MSDLKREVIKMVRDFIKKDYKIRDCCYICGSTTQLDLHHIFSLSELFNTWVDKNKIKLNNTEEQIKELRVTFATECADRLSNDNLYTLCKIHHLHLHNIYGQRYSNHMAIKVRNWIELQRTKHTEGQ
jgi:5-methylcytosine-specific restriction endonuclease McrA